LVPPRAISEVAKGRGSSTRARKATAVSKSEQPVINLNKDLKRFTIDSRKKYLHKPEIYPTTLQNLCLLKVKQRDKPTGEMQNKEN